MSSSGATRGPVLDRVRISMVASLVPGADRTEAMLSRPGGIHHFSGIDPIRPARAGRREKRRPGRRKARRWVVERTLAWLSKCRGLLVRYDKHAENFPWRSPVGARQ